MPSAPSPPRAGDPGDEDARYYDAWAKYPDDPNVPPEITELLREVGDGPPDMWKSKPVWCQPWTILLTGSAVVYAPTLSVAPTISCNNTDGWCALGMECVASPKTGAGTCVVLGVHLCGALSPRLITLCAHVEGIDAFGVSPCCIKGTLGEHVKRSAKELGRPNYDVILETLAEMADRELDGRGGVQLRRDDDMLSPRNGFVLGSKLRLSP